MEIKTAVHQLHPRGAFRTARKRTVPFDNVILRVEHDGVTGWGEASPHPYYGGSAPQVVRTLESLSGWLRTLSIRSVNDIAEVWQESWTRLHPDRAAQCALDLALWDWLARKEGVTVTELAHGHGPRPVTSFATIGRSTKEELDDNIVQPRTQTAYSAAGSSGRAPSAHARRVGPKLNDMWRRFPSLTFGR